jgi:hypothetical protein
MRTREKSTTVPEAQLSKQIATNDDAPANQEEVEEQIEGDNVQKKAHETGTISQVPIMRSNEETQTANDAVAAKEEVDEQAEDLRIDKVALEDTISAPSAEYIRRGGVHG